MNDDKSNLFSKYRDFTYEDRNWESFYRNRYKYDKVVPSTHGVNCTGSCRWNIFVKDNIVTWEMQATDYPSNGNDMPDYEPRGCPRGASFSWYLYSPLRIRYPYVRSELLNLYRDAKSKYNDPLIAYESIMNDEEKKNLYKKMRGKGGFIRSSWDEVSEIIAASILYTAKKYGPDRISGFSPIPAMSMVSYASGERFLSLIGGVLLSFYDWYADLPPASPQMWGEQTDSPESEDWFNSTYIINWGTNVPQTRTPDAHFYSEVRYRGAKVVAVSPDYAEYVKFADEWLPVKPGSDAALALAMDHVVLNEYYYKNNYEYLNNYIKKYSDLPFIVKLKKIDNNFVLDQKLRASEIGIKEEYSNWKMVMYDNKKGLCVPDGSIGYRWDNSGKWNLDLKDIDPETTFINDYEDIIPVSFDYFFDDNNIVLKRNVPVKKIKINGNDTYITTVMDTLFAYYGVNRNLNDESPLSYDDDKPFTPAWQEKISNIKREKVIKIAKEFVDNAISTDGRSMVLLGAGTNHWYHSDLMFRSIITLIILSGSQGKNGGGWAHYVGQEKIRPLMGVTALFTASDWLPAARLQNGTSFFYLHTDQWRYEHIDLSKISSKIIKNRYKTPLDYNIEAVKNGWLPFYPQTELNPLSKEKQDTGSIINEINNGKLKLSIEDPDNPLNFPRILFLWRSNLLAASGKGSDYFLKHLLGSDNNVTKEENIEANVVKRKAGEAKLDLLIDLDFRMSTSALYSDIVLPAATWYEKCDLSSTDMHPFIHTLNPAIPPQFESKTDWDIFKTIAKKISEIASKNDYSFYDYLFTPYKHDTPGELESDFGKNNKFQNIVTIKRDYSKIYDMYTTLGPRLIESGASANGITADVKEVYNKLKIELGMKNNCPSIESDKNAANAILALSPESNGITNINSWKYLEKKTNVDTSKLYSSSDYSIDFDSCTVQPRRTESSPDEFGIVKGNRPYSPFTLNVEFKLPWRTLTGRQEIYIDHPWFIEFGEVLPTYKPPLDLSYDIDINDNNAIKLKYITPHGKWNIHTTYFDNYYMLTLFRGGPVVWINNNDASKININDNDWVEVYNKNGSEIVRCVLSHRIPEGSCFLYHATERTINTKYSKNNYGSHNSVTEINPKPIHMIGGYAQLAWSPNYYGPVGNQRDAMVLIKKVVK